MSRLGQWGLVLCLAAALVALGRCTGRGEGADAVKLADVSTAIAATRDSLTVARAEVAAAHVATARAESIAAFASKRAAAQKAKSDSLDQRVAVLSDSQVSIDGGPTIVLPPIVVRNLVELRGTVASQTTALVAKDAEIASLRLELAVANKVSATAERLAGRLDEKVTIIEGQRPVLWRRIGGAVVTAGAAAGGAVIGLVVAGPAGAAVGASAGVILARIAIP